MQFLNYLKELFNKISGSLSVIFLPKVIAAGLEFKDTAVRIVGLNNNLKKAAVMLEPGVIDNGRIKDRNKLVLALKKLRGQMEFEKDKVPVIAIIPSINVYTKVFSTPVLDRKGLEEAALLNLKSISPIDFEKGYSDWQQVGPKETNGKIDVLGAFAESAAVDEYAGVLQETNFVPVAVEFPALSIARTIRELASDIDLSKPQVVINIASDGIDFMVVRNGDLYFDYFVSWKLIKEEGKLEREIFLEDFKGTIIREVKKMANFYGSHWGGKFEGLILITQALSAEISEIIKNNFQFQVVDLRLQKFTDLPASWFGVLGSALRGLMSRKSDTLISLMAVGTEALSLQTETRSFVKSWRNILITTFGFLVALFLLVDSFLANLSVNLTEQLQKITQVPGGEKIVKLQSQARVFNQLVEKAFVAKQQSASFSQFFVNLNDSLNGKIELTRISVDNRQLTAMIMGDAQDSAAALEFKNTLIKKGFQSVSLPLSNIIDKPAGGVSFNITFRLVK